MSEKEEIELWEDDSITLMESEIEEGSELADAVGRKAPRERASSSVPPHGPRAYKKQPAREPRPAARVVSEDEVLFDDARDFRSLPTMKFELPALSREEPAREASPLARPLIRYAIAALLVLVIAGGALFFSRYLDERAQVERREEVIRARLKAQ